MPDVKPARPKRLENSADDGVCAGHAHGFPMRSDLGFQPIEDITIDMFRCICDVYATGSAQPWEIAMKMGEERIGAIDGPHFVALVTALMRALRSERKSGFSYLSIGCQHVSPDELAIMGLLRSIRVRDKAASERGLDLALGSSAAGPRTRLAAQLLAAAQARQTKAMGLADAGEPGFESQTVQVVYVH